MIWSIWASLRPAAARLTCSLCFAGPVFVLGFADAGDQVVADLGCRGRWAGSGRCSGQRMQACSWMQGVA